MAAGTGLAVVLCALPVEYRAVRALLMDPRERELPGGTLFEEGQLADTRWRVALGQLGEGNVGAGIIAERAISNFAPNVVFFVGVAGALKDDILVGDVVVGSRVDAYQGGKAAEDFLARPRTWDAPYRLDQRVRRLIVTGGWPAPEEHLYRIDGAPPTVHLKPIAAGEVVLASRTSPLYAHLRLHYNDAVAIEMEGAGLAHAAYINDALPALVIRGISDTTSPDKGDLDAAGWQDRASIHAASFARALLRAVDPDTLPRSRVGTSADALASDPPNRVPPLPRTGATPSPKPRSHPNVGAVRRFVDVALSEADLDDLCLDHFPVVYHDFSATTGRRAKVRMLIEYADRHDRLDELVTLTRAANPGAYARNEKDLRT